MLGLAEKYIEGLDIISDSLCHDIVLLLTCNAVQVQPMSSCGVCVCVSVTFVHSVKTNKQSNARGVGRNRDSEPISGFTACCQLCTSRMLSTPCHRTMASCDTYQW